MLISDITDILMVTRNATRKKINKALEMLFEHIWNNRIKHSISVYLS